MLLRKPGRTLIIIIIIIIIIMRDALQFMSELSRWK